MIDNLVRLSVLFRVEPREGKMPFWKKDKETETKGKEKEGGKEARGKEKVNYKARLEHKQYLVSYKIDKSTKANHFEPPKAPGICLQFLSLPSL